MKIVLIFAPSPFAYDPAVNPPLGIGYIHSYLKSKGIDDVEIIDFSLYSNYDYEDTNDTKYLDEQIPLDADFYGISATSSVSRWIYEIAKYLKENTAGKIVAGGAHPTSMTRQTLEDTVVDYIIRGDGEEPMYQLVSGVDLDKIPGLCYWKDGKIVEKERHYHKNLDELPFPTRLDINKYHRYIGEETALHLITLRGCPYNCSFCDKTSVGRGVRFRSVENVMAEIDSINRQHGLRCFVICDEIFPLKKKRTQQFCEEFKKRNLKWRCWCRADLINEESLEMMKDAGLVSIQIGIESGDDGVLKSLNKSSTYEINKNALLTCKKIGMPIRCNLMFGNPGETKETLDNTIKLIEEAQPEEWTLSILVPVPGSDMWINPEKYGLIFDKTMARRNHYLMTNRWADSGVGDIWTSLKGVSNEELKSNLEYFVKELERVCPRDSVQDNVQHIHIDKVRIMGN